MANQTQSFVPPGFGVQTAYEPFFQPDTTVNEVVTLSPSIATKVQLQNFKNTDLVTQWYLDLDLNVTAPTGTTNTVSPLAPYSAIGSINLNVQNQFYPIQTTGIDLYIKNTMYPWYPKALANNQTPALAPTYPVPEDRAFGYDAQTITTSSVVWEDLIPLSPAMRFDSYAHIDFQSGQTVATNGSIYNRAYVGTQLMGGTNRSIFPEISFNPLVGSDSRNGLYTVTGTQTAAASGTATLTTYRDGYYFLGANSIPAPTNWVPVWITYPVTIGATSKWIYDLPRTFQILGVYARFFDPSSNTPMAVSNVSAASIKIGSGLYLRQDNYKTNLNRLYKQTKVPNLLPQGTIGFDFAHDENGNVTNRMAINTIVTNGAQIEVDLNTPMSSQGVVYLSVMALQYVQNASL